MDSERCEKPPERQPTSPTTDAFLDGFLWSLVRHAIQGVDKAYDLSPLTPSSVPSPDLSQAAEPVNQAEASCSIPQQLDGQSWALFSGDLEELGVSL